MATKKMVKEMSSMKAMKKSESGEGSAMRMKEKKGMPALAIMIGVGKPKAAMGKGGAVKKMNMGGYADGGMSMVNKDGKMVPSYAADGKGKMAKGGMAKKA
jgi:hypothetical protein